MSEDKTQAQVQQSQTPPKGDSLDALYKPLGIAAVCGANEAKKHHRKPDEKEQFF